MFFECTDMSTTIISIFEFNLCARNSVRSGHHPFHALTFRVKGMSDMEISDGSRVRLETGDIAFVPENLIYTQSNQEENLLIVHFTVSTEIPIRTIKKFTPRDPEHFEQMFRDIYTIWTKKPIGYMYKCKYKFYKIIFEIEQEFCEQNMLAENRKIIEAAEYISENYIDHTLTVDFLSHRYGMSTTYFRNQFCNVYSTTPLKYINDLRFKHATELLELDYLSIGEIAKNCGFDDANYFSRFIKRYTGLSPSEYRKQLLTLR